MGLGKRLRAIHRNYYEAQRKLEAQLAISSGVIQKGY